MPGPLLSRFPHRHNADGSCDSICPVCFRTVARCEREADLQIEELLHRCDPETLAFINLARSSVAQGRAKS
jgi:hypothetical protein